MKSQDRLKKAKRHIFSTGSGDSASRLARANMVYGLAKMHYVQEKYGLEPNATFISTPDETISRNHTRWNRGISYGGKIAWGQGRERLTILDTMPNCCGMLVGGLDSLPRPQDLIRRTLDMNKMDHYIQDVKMVWDFGKGNHFIDLFKVKTFDSKLKIPEYCCILHGGASEIKVDNPRGMGLYFKDSKILSDLMTEVSTPFGPCAILEGNDVKDYYKVHQFGEHFSAKRREIAFNEIFGSKKIILNKIHQGLVNYNEICLGCHDLKYKGELVPLSIRADLPSYIMRGKKNFTVDQLHNLGFYTRAESLGVLSRLKSANISPHGGGYMFPDVLDVREVFEIGGNRYFKMNMENGMGVKIVRDVKEVEFLYRGRLIEVKTIEMGMGELAAKLIPIYTLKL